MKNNFFKIALLPVLILAIQTPGRAQDESPKMKSDQQEEIIIKKKGDKDVKVTVEIKDSQVLINGKPLSEYEDDNVSIRKRVILSAFDGENFSFSVPPAPASPFRGGFSYNEDGEKYNNIKMEMANLAFLGVNSDKAEKGGAKVMGITEGSAAEKAGLQKGDVIIKIDDNAVTSPADLSNTVHKYKPEDKVTITILRGEKEQKLTAVLGKHKGVYTRSFNLTMPDMTELNGLGDLDRIYAPRAYSVHGKPRIGIKAQDTEDGNGVKVLDVDDESPADKAGIKEGDIITEFDGKPVNSAGALASLSAAAREKASFKVKLKRNDKSQEVEIKIPRKLKTAEL
jgi:serine protease Do